MDDLVLRPMLAISCFTLLNKFNTKDVGVLQEKTIDIGTDEINCLSKGSCGNSPGCTALLTPL
ncbi:DUF674 family protein [Gossypium australe]|uniref:DUF674 family protein n=1 Tax=Gossypium australe TaxID=47621 RepID=A0A5B6WJ55_9ROSI|nr:DUF674 family protein [Gossypium australe]